MLYKKGVLRNFTKFKEIHLCQRPQACNFIAFACKVKRFVTVSLPLFSTVEFGVKILVSEQIALVPMFCFAQVLVFCMLINKNVLEWFLLIICKECTLTRSANLSREGKVGRCSIPNCFLVKLTKAATGAVL